MHLPLIAITMGDPAGIGPEICLKALAEPRVLSACLPILFGDAALLDRVADRCGLHKPTTAISLDAWSSRDAVDFSEPTVVDCQAIDAVAVQPGKVDAECGKAAFAYIDAAIDAAVAHRVAAVATAPINKESLNLGGHAYPGHTEIFAERAQSDRWCMMQTSEKITVSFATTHIGHADVPKALTTTRVLDVIELTADAMRRIRGREPRLLVCGLNPHSGESGLFGRGEEERVIAPAVAEARARGIDVAGPLPPDTVFIPERLAESDAVVCMYHDQGHIPLKMLAFDTAVNTTLGLSIVRTSVDHGTAFDIAWQNRANPQSLVQAILLGARLGSGI